MSTHHKKNPKQRGSYAENYDSHDITAALNELVSNRRLKRGVSIKDVADKHGIPQSTLRRYRNKSIDAIASSPHKSNKKAINESTVQSANPPAVSPPSSPLRSSSN